MISSDNLESRFKKAKKSKERVQYELDECLLSAFPSLSITRELDAAIDKSNLIDTTPREAIDTLVTNIITYLLPVDVPFVHIGPVKNPNDQYDDDVLDLALAQPAFQGGGDLAETVEEFNHRFFKLLSKTNLNGAINTALKYANTCGTGAIGVEIVKEKLHYFPIHLRELFILQGEREIDSLFRVTKKPLRVLRHEYPNINFDEYCEDQGIGHEREQDEKSIEIIESNILMPNGKWYFGKHLLKGWKSLYEKELPYQRIVAFRADTIPGEDWGTCALRDMLPDVRVLFELIENGLDIVYREANPTYWSESETLRDQEIVANSTIISQVKPEQITTAGNDQLVKQWVDDYRLRILRGLYADALPPPQAKGDKMTRTEIQARQAEFFRKVRTLGFQIEAELVKPISRASLGALQSIQALPALEIDDKRIEISVTSLVSRGEELSTATSGLEAINTISANPLMAQLVQSEIDLKAFVRDALTALGMKHKYLSEEGVLSGEDVQNLIRQMAQGGMPQGGEGQQDLLPPPPNELN